MKKNILKVAFVAAIALVSGINVFNAHKTETLSDVALANVEALAMDEGRHKYEEKREDAIEIWDPENNVYKKVTTIVCEGVGSLDC